VNHRWTGGAECYNAWKFREIPTSRFGDIRCQMFRHFALGGTSKPETGSGRGQMTSYLCRGHWVLLMLKVWRQYSCVILVTMWSKKYRLWGILPVGGAFVRNSAAQLACAVMLHRTVHWASQFRFTSCTRCWVRWYYSNTWRTWCSKDTRWIYICSLSIRSAP